MSELKTKPTDSSVDEFLNSIEDDSKRSDCRKLVKIMRKLTGEKPRMWGPSIVGFGSYRYNYASGQEGDWPLTSFSPRKQALTVYIMPGFARYDSLMGKLGKYKTGKSCLYIKKLEDVDLEVLEELIDQSARHIAKTHA